MSQPVTLTALEGLPLFKDGDDLVTATLAAMGQLNGGLKDGDILVFAQKVVSKVEGRVAQLSSVTPSAKAEELALVADKDPRLVELILSESQTVMRCRRGVIIVRHRLGTVLANAGIDASNVDEAGDLVLLWPLDPDASCRRIREQILKQTGKNVAVVINDSIGRAWRMGAVGLAIGSDGLPALIDLRGRPDLFGRPLQVSEQAIADEVAGAASLVQGQAAESRPVVLVRGLQFDAPNSDVSVLLRPEAEDLFL
ncbi:coenzyme F420-0:L-glutamate ligase [Hwanghaeella sp. LZ110]|uniref:coenzyme F420-0:L-glutamate ligase n=1 Tax=Hwanghaeella sp. LZ110 TaxID=3402810 RepID=UPI003B681BF5